MAALILNAALINTSAATTVNGPTHKSEISCVWIHVGSGGYNNCTQHFYRITTTSGEKITKGSESIQCHSTSPNSYKSGSCIASSAPKEYGKVCSCPVGGMCTNYNCTFTKHCTAEDTTCQSSCVSRCNTQKFNKKANAEGKSCIPSDCPLTACIPPSTGTCVPGTESIPMCEHGNDPSVSCSPGSSVCTIAKVCK